jgi:3-deoxy-D-manno-octulosonate 8-phosphate phosphatase (KDO 8-P phosphatase)
VSAPPPEALARIKVLALDCDGTFTDGTLIYDKDGDDQHVFNVRDGHGLVLLRTCGVKLVMITGRLSASVERRAEELRFDRIVQHARLKGPILSEYCAEIGVSREEVCYVGDDINDIGAARFAGVGVAVADAVPELKAACGWITEARGGHGAIREVCEAILKAQGKWEEIVARYSEASAR